MHIAKIDYATFYQPTFDSLAKAQEFVSVVESISVEQTKAKIVLHQAARMIWLADRMAEIARGRPALQILFFIIAAETVAKLVFGFQGEGESKKHVQRFFEEVCSEKHRKLLSCAFERVTPETFLTLREAVDLLYSIRCDVTHEGRYFEFHLKKPGNDVPTITTAAGECIFAHITVEDLRQVTLAGAVLGAEKLLPYQEVKRYDTTITTDC